MHRFRDPLSRNTAQILPRRLYRHPLPLQAKNGSVLSIFSSTMSYEYPNDRSALFFDHRALPTIHRKMTLSNRRTQFARPSSIHYLSQADLESESRKAYRRVRADTARSTVHSCPTIGQPSARQRCRVFHTRAVDYREEMNSSTAATL